MITIDLNKAKLITHTLRRNKRAKEFPLLDIQATIPVTAQDAEAKRQAIRDYYATMQISIDNATSADELKILIVEFEGRPNG